LDDERIPVSINKTDYEQLKLPTLKLQSLNAKSKNITAITDTGVQSSFMGMKSFMPCGFNRFMLVPEGWWTFKLSTINVNVTHIILYHLSAKLEPFLRQHTGQ